MADDGATDSIVVIDADEAMRTHVEDGDSAVAWSVVAMESLDSEPDAREALVAAAAIVIALDLGFQSGLDLLEAIRRTPELEARPVLIADAAPTRRRVECALWLGANGFCLRPYDHAEIDAQLRALGAFAAPATGASDAGE